MCQVSTFLLLNMKYEPRIAIAEILFLKFFNLMSLLQYLCNLDSLCLLSFKIYPVFDPISNGRIETLNDRMSVSKCWYFPSLMLCAIEILDSPGTVNSNISRDFVFLSIITMSGLRVVMTISGGIVPPPCVWWPSISI